MIAWRRGFASGGGGWLDNFSVPTRPPSFRGISPPPPHLAKRSGVYLKNIRLARAIVMLEQYFKLDQSRLRMPPCLIA